MDLSSLFKILSGEGIAPYGARHGWDGAKGKGYFGELQGVNGVSTELSAENDEFSYPLITPNQPRQYIDELLSGGNPTEEMYRLAEKHARDRRLQGLSPFAQPTEFRFPFPKE